MNYEVSINEYLDNSGLKHSHMGYQYLIEALKITTNSKESIKVGEIYNEIAKTFKTSPFCVERSIRHSLSKIPMSNKEFIAKASHDIGYNTGTVNSTRYRSLFNCLTNIHV